MSGIDDTMFYTEDMDYDEYLRLQRQSIKHSDFGNDVFRWYILTRKDTEDFGLFLDIINGKDLETCQDQIEHNIQRKEKASMSYEDLIYFYISKKFNQKVLRPMCRSALKNDLNSVNRIASL